MRPPCGRCHQSKPTAPPAQWRAQPHHAALHGHTRDHACSMLLHCCRWRLLVSAPRRPAPSRALSGDFQQPYPSAAATALGCAALSFPTHRHSSAPSCCSAALVPRKAYTQAPLAQRGRCWAAAAAASSLTCIVQHCQHVLPQHAQPLTVAVICQHHLCQHAQVEYHTCGTGAVATCMPRYDRRKRCETGCCLLAGGWLAGSTLSERLLSVADRLAPQ